MAYSTVNPVALDQVELSGNHFWEVWPQLFHVSDNLFLMGWGENGDTGLHIASFRVDHLSGQITAVGDVAYVPNAMCANSIMGGICHVQGNVYACTYEDLAVNQLGLFTFTCDGNGNLGVAYIQHAIIGALLFNYSTPRILKVQGDQNIVAVAWVDDAVPLNGLTVTTIPISGSGAIGAAIDTWIADSSTIIVNDFRHIYGTVYSLETTWPVGHQIVYTFDIQENGVLPPIDGAPGPSPSLIGRAYINTWKGRNSRSHMIQLADNLYLCGIIEDNPVNSCRVATFTISNAGAIGNVIDDWKLSTANQFDPAFAIVGPNENNNGNIVLGVTSEWGGGITWRIFEVLNTGIIVKNFIAEEIVNDGVNGVLVKPVIENASYLSQPQLVMAYEGTDVAWDFYCFINTHALSRVVIYPPPVVTTLPATNVLRT